MRTGSINLNFNVIGSPYATHAKQTRGVDLRRVTASLTPQIDFKSVTGQEFPLGGDMPPYDTLKCPETPRGRPAGTAAQHSAD